jgi:hypothetical protein
VVNVLDNANVDIAGDLRAGEDNDFTANFTLNMSSTGTIFIGENLNLIDDGSASGFSTVNLTNGVIDIQDEVRADTDNWVINICGDGIVIMNGDQVDRTLDQAADGHWVACPGENCWGEIVPLGTLMVDYDNVNPGRTTVWAETIPEEASSPTPEDGAVDVPTIGTELCWCPGEGSTLTHLYFGTDEALVAAHYPTTEVGIVTSCYDPGPLQLCTTYYWMIVEQVGVDLYYGPVWSFTTECCRIIEGFENYDINGEYVWDHWIDGCGDLLGFGGNATGSCVSLSIDTIHEGAKAMTYTYENEPYGIWNRDANNSEATRTFDPPLDLTLTGEVALVAYFYGDGDNDLTDMWVLLNGSVADMAVYGDNGEDAADIQVAEWQEWNMDFAGFAGVDLSNVATVSIGFGDKSGNIADSAMGIVRFDDISVCPVRCIPMFIDHIIDLNDDCVSDWLDVGIMGDNWLSDLR